MILPIFFIFSCSISKAILKSGFNIADINEKIKIFKYKTCRQKRREKRAKN